jgi:mannose-6-phosphate isomerase-like protein (cupin superfamily)
MDTLNINNASKMECCSKAGLISHILLNTTLDGIGNVNCTWVDIEPGRFQPPHAHGYDQVYIVINGTGIITIENETSDLPVGTRVTIPKGKTHTIKNDTVERLSYLAISAKE